MSKSPTKSLCKSFYEMLHSGILDSHEIEVEVRIESDKSSMFAVSRSNNNPNITVVTDFYHRLLLVEIIEVGHRLNIKR